MRLGFVTGNCGADLLSLADQYLAKLIPPLENLGHQCVVYSGDERADRHWYRIATELETLDCLFPIQEDLTSMVASRKVAQLYPSIPIFLQLNHFRSKLSELRELSTGRIVSEQFLAENPQAEPLVAQLVNAFEREWAEGVFSALLPSYRDLIAAAVAVITPLGTPLCAEGLLTSELGFPISRYDGLANLMERQALRRSMQVDGDRQLVIIEDRSGSQRYRCEIESLLANSSALASIKLFWVTTDAEGKTVLCSPGAEDVGHSFADWSTFERTVAAADLAICAGYESLLGYSLLGVAALAKGTPLAATAIGPFEVIATDILELSPGFHFSEDSHRLLTGLISSETAYTDAVRQQRTLAEKKFNPEYIASQLIAVAESNLNSFKSRVTSGLQKLSIIKQDLVGDPLDATPS